MKIRYICALSCVFLSITTAYSQESELQKRYREMALEYNQDVQASEKNIEISKELEKSAKTDYKPKLSAGANFNYTGNPMELSLDIAAFDNPVHFQAKDTKYGTSVSLSQPIYAGGKIRESVKMAQNQTNLAQNQSQMIKADISYQADSRYWNAVARREIAGIMQSYQYSVNELVAVIDERVKAEMISRNDLLMAEVKLNEVSYQLKQAQNNCEVARLSLNSFIGIGFNDVTRIDTVVPAIEVANTNVEEFKNLPANRAETRMAQDKISIQESMLKIRDSQFRPQFHIGADGSYSSPGYNFNPDLDPNYSVYAKLSVPLFEWGKKKREKKASEYRIGIAKDNYSKIEDHINLEVKSAYYSYNQAVDQVILTQSSLDKAKENENMAIDRYKEGLISIAEVLDAQLFHQTAQINYVQSRVNAQLSFSGLKHALGKYQF